MKESHEKTLEMLHGILHQVFREYLERIGSEGISSADIDLAVSAYMENEYPLQFITNLRPDQLDFICCVNGSNLFSGVLQLGKVTPH